ncbi:hypothetical protein A0128_12260 [Leptospira tipperaryensis]|uniref:Uncharacterized protein n=1 Tax=Leptospira tipperaryensis TaxID=2564040 RepID=A0A1D7UY86_9LEPT|nr:hypothetical protein A0128_12260 [Leptospira tipperaryensis]
MSPTKPRSPRPIPKVGNGKQLLKSVFSFGDSIQEFFGSIPKARMNDKERFYLFFKRIRRITSNLGKLAPFSAPPPCY